MRDISPINRVGPEDDIFYNPDGIWYSRGNSFYKFIDITAGKLYKYNHFRWLPLHVYELDLSELKIKSFKNCQDLYDFSEKYKDKKKDYSLKWTKIRKDYDVVDMYPFVIRDCIDMSLKDYLKIDNSDNRYMAIGKWLLQHDLSAEQKSILWGLRWDADSGVVVKNKNKIKFKIVELS